MTREKIVKDMSLQDAIQVLRDTNAFGTMDIAKSVILKALQQEPCEDAISRQAVLDLVNSDWKYEGLETDVVSLPSVNPQKIGHWIADVDKWGDVVTTVNGYRCDKCNTFNADKDNYCPNCGAKMVEPKESEDK